MSSPRKISIFDYIDLTEYLQDFIKSKESASKAYSFRALSLKLNGISYSQLYQIIKGKKRFPVSLANDFSNYILKLNRKEMKYFKALIEINHHLFEDASLKQVVDLKKNLQQLKPLEIKHVAFNDIMSRPLTMVIFEMINRKDIKNVVQVSPSLFYQNYSHEMISESLHYLCQSGHIRIDENGMFERLLPHLMSSNDIPSQHIKNYHKEVSSYASTTIDIVDVSLREYQSYAINIRKKDITKAKELIRDFVHEFARLMESSSNELDATYNLNLQFFPLLKDLK